MDEFPTDLCQCFQEESTTDELASGIDKSILETDESVRRQTRSERTFENRELKKRKKNYRHLWTAMAFDFLISLSLKKDI